MKLKLLLFVISLLTIFSYKKDNEKIIFLADSSVNCTGVSPQKCLQIKDNEKVSWSNFYGNIQGFKYEEGFSYKLKVEITKIENPPADASSEKFVLLEVLKKTKTPVELAKVSWLVTKI